ncbi:hypothetical protein AUJ42_01580 [Candidatus Collierbacteria bacterium CG1_02_44_10]|uniref:Ribbon-helix-helix protein CopG domain-containing protein n=4 Tax=Candidatus Collieribacteriota TaxID=1752725 RepID=A0A2H0DUN8_9BACT|nr:hypothetical protein [bacterium]OIN91657.1 MAG: hypothetical protein AUJ42_01580 [Candidatus Collierbacteria bacterium CG1_02_44_10]PIP85916.1 MAG: hypothetical protein COW83_01725 [Candidatus Collierbacteria bacterium CG22_combo_CG10-13_8_21_14_all_43_12]PIR99968.1 MAG: hypothetical protein COT86_01150 [Candidatus Collierbacteria bacterium CG10_big_fil_rev_8_21_14_0_10_43_36]PIZ24251.1 MAG: hypothetical protein COY48_03955 [Candidatus Collierbacteria bacterium CG_4_10_14_0_8_um_filter_43_86
MIRTQIYLPDDIYEDLQLISQSSKLNISQLIREGAKKEIKARTKQINKDDWKQFAGALKTGPKDLSLKINDIYK